MCSGWGNSHYNTFDGTSYSFVDNCTHVLMREIRPRHGNLSIYMHNYYCGATSATAQCPRALSARYKSTEVILTTSTGANGQEEPLVSGPALHHPGRPAGLEVSPRRGLWKGKGRAMTPRGPERSQLGLPQGLGAPAPGRESLQGRPCCPTTRSWIPHPHPRYVLRYCLTESK